MRILLAAALLCLGSSGAWAQGAVQQSGPVTPGHIASWVQDHVIKDGGLPTSSNLTVSGALLPITAFGGVGDGVTDNTGAFNATIAANPTGRACVAFPPGVFLFNSHLAVAGSFCLRGGGPAVTRLVWPNAGGGITVSLNKRDQGVNFFDVEMATGAAGGGTAIEVDYSGPTTKDAVQLIASSMFSNVMIGGNDGALQVDYWNKGIRLNSVSNANFVGVTINGDGPSHGDGIDLEATAAVQGTVYNIYGANINGMNHGLIYGSYIQGVVISASNFNFGTVGVFVPPSEVGLDQLSIADSSLNNAVANVYFSSGVPGTAIHDNVFIIGNTTVPNAAGIVVANGNTMGLTISHNTFQGGGQAGSTGVNIACNPICGNTMIQGNVFTGMVTAIDLTNSEGTNVTLDQVFVSNGTNILNPNTCVCNHADGYYAYNISFGGATTPGTITYQSRQAIGGQIGIYTHYNFTLTTDNTGLVGAAGNLIITGIPKNTGGIMATCSVQTPTGLTVPTGYGTYTGQILPGTAQIQFATDANPTSGVGHIAQPSDLVGTNGVWIYGTCFYPNG